MANSRCPLISHSPLRHLSRCTLPTPLDSTSPEEHSFNHKQLGDSRRHPFSRFPLHSHSPLGNLSLCTLRSSPEEHSFNHKQLMDRRRQPHRMLDFTSADNCPSSRSHLEDRNRCLFPETNRPDHKAPDHLTTLWGTARCTFHPPLPPSLHRSSFLASTGNGSNGPPLLVCSRR